MDNLPAQQENPTIVPKSSVNSPNRTITISIIALLFGFFLGFISWSFLPFGKLPTPASNQEVKVVLPSPAFKPAIDESKLPISLNLLTNPIVDEWRGGVRGKLISKNEHDFTLVDDQGHSITITDKMPSGDIFKAMFFDKSDISKQISLSDIPLGSVLIGDFFIFKGAPNIPVGSSFIKQ